MKLLAVAALLLQLLAAASAQSSIVLFGDSFSDNGNGYAANAQFVLRTDQVFPEAPYFEGRWSNGPTWIEVASQQLGATLTDYGAGGATTGLVPAQIPLLPPPFANLTAPAQLLSPTLFQQLNSHFLATSNAPLDPNALYIVFIGANDYLSIPFAQSTVTAPQVVANIEDALSQLAERGATKFLLPTIPPLNMLAVFQDPTTYGAYPAALVAEAGTQSTDHNLLLQELALSFPDSHAGANVTVLDFAGSFAEVMTNAASLGITNTQQPCYITAPVLSLAVNGVPNAQPIGYPNGTLCSDPDAHLSWDQFHPTRVVHQALGQAVAPQLGPLVTASA